MHAQESSQEWMYHYFGWRVTSALPPIPSHPAQLLVNDFCTDWSEQTRQGPHGEGSDCHCGPYTPSIDRHMPVSNFFSNLMFMLLQIPINCSYEMIIQYAFYCHKGPLYWKLLCYWIGMIRIWSICHSPDGPCDLCTDMIGFDWDWLWWLLC